MLDLSARVQSTDNLARLLDEKITTFGTANECFREGRTSSTGCLGLSGKG
jgi:hypothetical protein